MSEDNDSFLSVGATVPFNYNKKLLDELTELKSVTERISSELCSLVSKTSISIVTPDDIKNCGKLQKKHLADHVLSLLQHCKSVSNESCMDMIRSPPTDHTSSHQSLLSEVSKCVQEQLSTFCESQTNTLNDINVEVKRLSDYVSATTHHNPPPHNPPPHSDMDIPKSLAPIHIENPTQCLESYIPGFVSADQSNTLTEFLDGCRDFSVNNERGHSVAMFGYPYHYSGSKHSGKPTDIPEPIESIISLISDKYPDHEQLNSCLVNKYCGPEALLPRHSDDEFSIDPESSVFTVSLGTSVTVKFTDIGSGHVVEKETEPNSLYVMSRKSQNYWQHEIPKNCLAEGEVRYSLTFRRVSDQFQRSTVIVGDSNTANLNFGQGKGTFGALIPGKRVEAIHIEDITPSDCCGYKNIFVNCGINNIKHYNINSSEKISTCFDNLKSKIDEILVLCPNSKVVVSPILPTKRHDWNKRAMYFNSLLFKYANTIRHRFTTLRFGMFVDGNTGLLCDILGSYWNPDDPLHLGSKGIRALARLIREQVYSSRVTSNISYSDMLQRGGVAGMRMDHDTTSSGQTSVGVT